MNNNIKKMQEFIDKIFKRSKEPLEELKRIYNIHPIFFACEGCVEYINNYLKVFGYTLNPEALSMLNGPLFSCWHQEPSQPTYGPCHGPSLPFGCGSSSGSYGESFGGCSGGGGLCMSEQNSKGKVKLLIRIDNTEDNNTNVRIAY